MPLTQQQTTEYTYAAFEDEDGTWYVNEYFRDAAGIARRATLYDGLTKGAADALVRTLEKLAPHRFTE